MASMMLDKTLRCCPPWQWRAWALPVLPSCTGVRGCSPPGTGRQGKSKAGWPERRGTKVQCEERPSPGPNPWGLPVGLHTGTPNARAWTGPALPGTEPLPTFPVQPLPKAHGLQEVTRPRDTHDEGQAAVCSPRVARVQRCSGDLFTVLTRLPGPGHVPRDFTLFPPDSCQAAAAPPVIPGELLAWLGTLPP